MGLSVHQIDGQLFVSGQDGIGTEFRRDISSLLILGDDLGRFIKPIIDDLRLKRPSTIKGTLHHLQALGEAMSALGITSLPANESGWQVLVRDIHHFIITRPDSAATLKTRISSIWMTIRGFLVSLVEAGVMPISVYLPPVREALESLDISAYHDRLIGQKAPVGVDVLATIEKLICPVSLARTDAELLTIAQN